MCGLRDSIPCDMIQVGYRDALGNDRADIENEILKTNLDVNGNPIGKTDKSQVVLLILRDLLGNGHRSNEGRSAREYEARRRHSCCGR